ncbi:MAG: peptidase [Verrucomicrobiae bacterium]|nr:peptidase [Verrucomicrobiae bacterium]
MKNSRRQFMKSVAGSAAVIAAPAILRAEDKAGTKPVIVGEGEHTYECLHNWGTLPHGHHYGGASHGIAVDSNGLVYVSHHGGPGSIFVFDPSGKFVRAMGFYHTVDGSGRGHGIDIRKEEGGEFLYLSPDDGRFGFTKATLEGDVVWVVDVPKDSGKYDAEKPRYRPTNVSFNPNGDVYLGDGYGSNLIHRYTQDGRYLGTFGATGSGKGEFKTPHGQWLDARDGTPKTVIADRANARLQYMSLDGEHLSFVEGLLFPADIDIQGDIMLVPDLHARITLFDKDNKVISHLGDDEEWRKQVLDGNTNMRGKPNLWVPGKFVHPHDACFDKDGNILVAEWVVTGRVSMLRKVG